MVEQVHPDLKTIDIDSAVDALKGMFPDAISDDTREGYSGIMVSKDKLTDVALAIRDSLGFDLLSSATAVDYGKRDRPSP
ncbi:MAG: hypothetical protein AAF787_23440 [Chloroflexota bacterium]